MVQWRFEYKYKKFNSDIPNELNFINQVFSVTVDYINSGKDFKL